MLLLAILNRLKSFRWHFLVSAIHWIYCKVELLQHVNLKRNNKCYWLLKRCYFTIYWQAFIFQPNHFPQLVKHHYKIISQGNGKFVAYTPCLKCHVHNKLTGLSWLYVGIGSLVCIVNLPITPVSNVLMGLGRQGNGTEDFSRQWLFQPGNYHHEKPYLWLVTHSYSDKLVLRRIQYFVT